MLMEEGKQLYEAGREALSIPIYRRVTEDGAGNFIRDSLSAVALRKLANSASWVDSISTDRVLGFYRKALQLQQQLLPDEHEDVTRTLCDFGSYLISTNQLDSASYYLYSASHRYEHQSNPDITAWLWALFNLVQITAARRDRQLTEEVVRKAGRLLDAHRNQLSPEQLFQYYYNFTYHPSGLGLVELTKENAAIAIKIARAHGGDGQIPHIYNLVQRANLINGSYEEAYRYIDTTLSYAANQKALWQSSFYNNKATVEIELGYHLEALESAKQALRLADTSFTFYNQLYTNMATAYWKLGRHEQVLPYIDLAIKAIYPFVLLTDYSTLTSVLDSLSAEDLRQITFPLIERARYRAAVGSLPLACKDYDLALDAHERLRGNAISEDGRRTMSKDVRRLFDEAVRTSIAVYTATQDTAYLWRALKLSDRARAYTLEDRLRRNQTERSFGVQAIERELATLEAQAARTEEPNDRIRQLRLQRLLLTRDDEQTESTRAGSFSQDSLMTYLVKNDKTLLHYHVSDMASHVIVVRPNGGIFLANLPAGERLNEQVKAFRNGLFASQYRRKSLRGKSTQLALDEAFRTSGQELARQLIPPEALRYTQADTVFNGTRGERQRLLVVPDGDLSLLPLSALPLYTQDEEWNWKNYTSTTDLVDIQHTYSLVSLLAQNNVSAPPSEALIMAPRFSGHLYRLDHNQREAQTIQPLIGNPEVVLERQASRAKFLAAHEGSGLIHLSTHGYTDGEEPNLSYVAFSQSGDTLDPNEVLYFPEISTLNLSADLVVLSACETNLGKYIPGETALSLSSAFTAAGARSTLTSLWRVDDEATAELMKYFYKELAKGEDRSAALGTAQRKLRKQRDYVHPYYWAGFVLHGVDGPVELPRRENWWPWLIGALALMGLSGMGYRHFSGPKKLAHH